MIVNVVVGQRQTVDALCQHLLYTVLHAGLVPSIEETRRKPRQKLQPPVGFPQQQRPSVRADRTSVEAGHHLPRKCAWNPKLDWIHSVIAKAACLLALTACVETQLCHERRLFAIALVR